MILRNLTSSQRACIAVEAKGIIERIQAKVSYDKIEKLLGNQNASKNNSMCQLIDTPFKNPERTDVKVANLFNTNRTYVNEVEEKKGEFLEDNFKNGGDRKSDKIRVPNRNSDKMPASKKESAMVRRLKKVSELKHLLGFNSTMVKSSKRITSVNKLLQPKSTPELNSRGLNSSDSEYAI